MPKLKKGDESQKEVAVQIVPSKDKVSERIYSNFVQVTHSLHDFTLTFCDVLPISNEQKSEIVKSKKIQAPIQAEIVIPHSLVEPLIKAMTENYEKYKKTKK